MRYVAFLRGINVGGRTKVSMVDLKAAFEALGFSDVKTILNSGNVTFMTDADDNLQTKISQALLKKFGWSISVLIRTSEEIRDLIAQDPFKAITVSKDTRLYVTFFSEDHAKKVSELKHVEKDMVKVLRLSPREICWMLTITPNRNTTDMMTRLEKEFGKAITTRNWNTVIRVAA